MREDAIAGRGKEARLLRASCEWVDRVQTWGERNNVSLAMLSSVCSPGIRDGVGWDGMGWEGHTDSCTSATCTRQPNGCSHNIRQRSFLHFIDLRVSDSISCNLDRPTDDDECHDR